MQESFQAEQKRLEEERRSREVQRRRQELQDIEKKQAMDKIAALKKTTVGAKALKDLTPEVRVITVSYFNKTVIIGSYIAHFMRVSMRFGFRRFAL